MPRDAPGWWSDAPDRRTSTRDWLTKAALTPLAWLYGAITPLRFALARPYRANVPVICIGNFTAGGAGKTPTAIAVAEMLQDMEVYPTFLSRGYGGARAGSHLVNPDRDHAGAVGDEPLLLARHAPTVISRNRKAGAALIERQHAGAIIMDDGFQNPQLAKDFSLVVVDAAVGVGNGAVIPAGPLRAPLGFQARRADALLLIGEGGAGEELARRLELPVLRGRLVADADTRWLEAGPVIAYSGIGRPAKFFETLERLGARITGRYAFPDHHDYTPEDAAKLLTHAQQAEARLVTTQKDWVRMPEGRTPVGALKLASHILPVRLVLDADSEGRMHRMLAGVVGQ
ncbi:tetraacyldisaccharide 4'-kinase [Dichotomicrobium thermohalophilum]|uniref:Tetraacyldisaccharide 4'-kinase n=1 Tax=Dichotomicrobium thermohalophilum TaxID=933063 RepID=A0A397PJP8_9HYPH|nr:tetraacyldisaccharide 4'-kinase [Dichotomicrobium thermohalophilum]RIA47387.1 lipid-A-disaccharide kinase [Dichotomicrobium thermohalophilum]